MSYGRRSVTFDLVQAHATGHLGNLTSAALDLLNSQVAAIRVDSNLGPVTIDEPFNRSPGAASSPAASGASGAPGAPVSPFSIERWLQPAYTIIDREGGETRVAPYGTPTHNFRPVLVVLGLGILGLAVFGGTKLK